MLCQELDRHIALEPLVEGEMHGGHATNAESPFHPVSPCDCRSVHGPFPPLPLPPPPSPAPPLPLVLVVPEVAVVVAEVGVLVGVEVAVELLVELLEGEEVELLELLEEVLVDVVVLEVVWQSLAAS